MEEESAQWFLSQQHVLLSSLADGGEHHNMILFIINSSILVFKSDTHTNVEFDTHMTHTHTCFLVFTDNQQDTNISRI